MSPRKTFSLSVFRTILSFGITVLSFIYLPSELVGLAVFMVLCTLLLGWITILAFQDLRHGTGYTPRKKPRY